MLKKGTVIWVICALLLGLYPPAGAEGTELTAEPALETVVQSEAGQKPAEQAKEDDTKQTPDAAEDDLKEEEDAEKEETPSQESPEPEESAFAEAEIIKDDLQKDTYTIYGKMELGGEDYKINRHLLPVEIPADKLVVVAYLLQTDETGDPIPEYMPGENYDLTYLTLREEQTDKDCAEWGGGHAYPSRLRYFKTTKAQHGSFYVSAGAQKKLSAKEVEPFTWRYVLSVRIIDAVSFAPLDAQSGISGDRNFFLSSGPEHIKDEHLYSETVRQNLCRAPVNGNANIYWSHVDKTTNGAFFGVLLTNQDTEPLEITTHANTYYNINSPEEVYDTANIYTQIFAERMDLSAGLAGKFGAKKEILRLEPGESKWLVQYKMNKWVAGDTTGVVNISVNNGSYTGQKLICTTYAFEDYKYIDYIPINTADWEKEAAPDVSAMRGSGNGAVLDMVGEPKKIPFETMLAGEDKMNDGEHVLLSRLENGTLHSWESRGSVKRLDLDEKGNLPKLTDDQMRSFRAYSCNFGTIYKIDANQLKAEYGLEDGKKVVGKIKFSARTAAILSNDALYQKYYSGLNIAVWRTKNGLLDMASDALITVGRNQGIDPEADNIHFYPNDPEMVGQISRSREGVYWVFDENVPLFDKANDYTYYVVASGMSSLPFELSFDYEDITLQGQPYTIYVDDRPVSFDDVQPQIIDGRMMIPLRGLFEQFGADIDFRSNTVTMFIGDRVITAGIGDGKLVILDAKKKRRRTVQMDVAPMIVNGRTMIPLRAVSESIGKHITWADDIQSVFIY